MDYGPLIACQRAFFDEGRTLGLDFRRRQLDLLGQVISDREPDLLEALRADLGKPALEAYTSEIGFVLSDIDHARRRLRAWMRARAHRTPPIAWPGRSLSRPQPYGVALILGPWNYPFQLLFSPLVGALAAGNCVCLKPSEYAPHTSALIAEMLTGAFEPEHLLVIEGDADTARALLAERFDYIFFTGSTAVGREVMAAAARRTIPVTLELGGKSPCLVCADADPDLTARRILWGKCLNAGQTCAAPDYVLADRRIQPELLASFTAAYDRFFPDSPRSSPDLGRIVNHRHFDRLRGYLAQGRVILGGEHDADDLFLAPTVMTGVDPESPLMQEEIFGPILPVLTFDSLDSALEMLRRRPQPLALYIFTSDRATADRIVTRTSSGGVAINDTVSQIMGKNLPLGGIGESGLGSYRGRASFDTFTHYRSILRRGTAIDPGFRYPPSRVSLTTLKRVYRFLLGR